MRYENTTWTNVMPDTEYILTNSYSGFWSVGMNVGGADICYVREFGSGNDICGSIGIWFVADKDVVKTYTFPAFRGTTISGASASCPAKTANIYYDIEKPVCTYSENYEVITNKDVTLTIGCDDKSGSGCKVGTGTSKTLTASGKGTLETTIYDNAGNSTKCSKVYDVIVDKTGPTCTYSNNYNTSSANDVTLTIGCSDSGTGCKVGSSGTSKTLTASGKGTLETTIYDNAGNSTKCSKAYDVIVDKEKPTCSLSASGTEGSNGWYIGDITINATFKDTGGSGVASKGVSTSSSATYNGSVSYSVTENTAGKTIYCYVKDNVGNTGKNSITVKKDDGSDVSCYTQGENTTWSNGAKNVKYGVNSISGCWNNKSSNYCYVSLQVMDGNPWVTKTYSFSKPYIRLGSGASITCPSKTANVYHDGEAPTCTYSSNYSTTSNGNVVLTIGCDDGDGSGCKTGSSGTSKTLTVSGKGTLETTIYDNAGNSTTCSKAYDVIIDKVPPTCTYTGDFNAITNKDVTLSIGCSDSGSGCTADSGRTKTLTASGGGKIATTIYDKAGNSTECSKTYILAIDKETPTCSISVTTSGVSGITGTVTVTDTGGSGLATDSSYSFSSLKSDKTYTMTDNAGNSATCTVDVGSKRQKRTNTCKTYNTCENSSCGYKTCTDGNICGWSYTAWTNDRCRATENACYRAIADESLQRCVYQENCRGLVLQSRNLSANTCEKEGCGNKSCSIAACGCYAWNGFSSWTDTTSCTASSTNSKKVECRTFYYKN